MALTRDFKQTIKARAAADTDFAMALLDEALTLFLNATVGFEQLAYEVQRPSKSLHRMLSPAGNPTMSNLSAIIAAMKNSLHVDIKAEVIAA